MIWIWPPSRSSICDASGLRTLVERRALAVAMVRITGFMLVMMNRAMPAMTPTPVAFNMSPTIATRATIRITIALAHNMRYWARVGTALLATSCMTRRRMPSSIKV